jgi:hypothetical protein
LIAFDVYRINWSQQNRFYLKEVSGKLLTEELHNSIIDADVEEHGTTSVV